MSKYMLIVDDDEMTRSLIRLVFEFEGFTCIETDNGATAIDALASQDFNIILLDHMMPIMTGLDFLAHVQQAPKTTQAPIIMLTGCFNQKVHDQATKLGAYAILSKPYDIGELRELVLQLCTPQRAPFFKLPDTRPSPHL